MIYAHSNSVSLRSKIEILKNFAPDECLEDEMIDFRILPTSEEVLTNAMKVRLWRLVVSKLLRRPENANLKSLDWTDTCFDRTLDSQEILETDIDSNESEGILNDDDWFEEDGSSIEDNTLDEGLFESEGSVMLDSEDEVLLEQEDYMSKAIFSRDSNKNSYPLVEVILDSNEEFSPESFLSYAPTSSIYQDCCHDDEMLMDELSS